MQVFNQGFRQKAAIGGLPHLARALCSAHHQAERTLIGSAAADDYIDKYIPAAAICIQGDLYVAPVTDGKNPIPGIEVAVLQLVDTEEGSIICLLPVRAEILLQRKGLRLSAGAKRVEPAHPAMLCGPAGPGLGLGVAGLIFHADFKTLVCIFASPSGHIDTSISLF